jgi:hypothetical protein
MGKIPNSDNANPKVGGTSMAANNKFAKGVKPEMGVESIGAFAKPSASKGMVNKAVLNNKENAVGGTPMGK